MKLITTYALTAFLAIVLLGSCKRTYTCTCPSVLERPGPYLFEVKAASSRRATHKCIEAGKTDKLVGKEGSVYCRIYAPGNL